MRPTLARAYSGSRKARIGADETENRFATPLDERFDLVYCFGILHRVENPLGLLRVLRGRTASGGTVLVETYGVRPEERDGPAIRVSEPGDVYAHDEFVYWGFGDTGLERLARIAGFSRADSLIHVEVDGHPRIMVRLIA